MKLLLLLLRTENEENAILCMKIIIDLHRSFSKPATIIPGSSSTTTTTATATSSKPGVDATVEEFLHIVAEIFEGMKDVVRDTFATTGTPGESSEVAQSPAAGVGALDGSEGPDPTMVATGGILPLGMKSFKLLQDCPAAIVFIFQTYRHLVEHAMEIFIPLVFSVSLLLLLFFLTLANFYSISF